MNRDKPKRQAHPFDRIRRAGGQLAGRAWVWSFGHGAMPVHPLAVLIGLALGWQWSGLQRLVASAIDPLPATATMVSAIALLAAAVGPWLPERAVHFLARLAERRHRLAAGPGGGGAGTFWMLQALRDRDEPLLWTLLSLSASVAGSLSLLTLVFSSSVIRCYRFMLTHFLWTDGTLAVLEWIGVGLLLGGSWAFHGLVVSTLWPVTSTRTGADRSPPGVAAGLLLGFALTLLARGSGMTGMLSGGQEYMLGVLPMFVLAGRAVRHAQRLDHRRRRSDRTETDAPEIEGRGQGLIWVSLVIWGVSSGLVGMGWWACRSAHGGGLAPGDAGAGWGMLLLGLGVVLGAHHASRGKTRRGGPSGCGLAVWAAGVGAALSATLASPASTGRLREIAQVCLFAVPLGYALHYVERAWLARVGSGTIGFSQLTSAILAGLAMGLTAGRWLTLPALGPMGTLTAGSLVMLGFGGLVQIYESDVSPRTRRYRLALVFASLAAAIGLFPGGARRWDERTRSRTVVAPSIGESARLFGLGSTDGRNRRAAPRNICLIGVDPQRIPVVASGRRRIAVMPISVDGLTPRGWPAAHDNPQVFPVSGFRGLRLRRERYDLVYQQSDPYHCVNHFGEYSLEWLSRLAEHTVLGGRVVLDVPLERMTPEAVVLIAATMETAMDAPAFWRLVRNGGLSVLRLTVRPGAEDSLPSALDSGGIPVERLLAEHPVGGPHTLRRDRLTTALKGTSETRQRDTVVWLEDCARSHESPQTLWSNPLSEATQR